ncbi:hypothetical protein N7G274_007352 [Stereocaulon virgatum]|uniref:Uncharacterized protein n=1 Tax=Stereocaulon virgatum TaxID=373712 RepID=A0ABR4A5A4_9LECA
MALGLQYQLLDTNASYSEYLKNTVPSRIPPNGIPKQDFYIDVYNPKGVHPDEVWVPGVRGAKGLEERSSCSKSHSASQQ